MVRDDDCYNPYESEYLRQRDSSYKVKNLVFVGVESNPDFHRCPHCFKKWRLEIRDDGKGNKVGVCIRCCGKTYQLVQQQQQQNKLSQKYGEAPSKPILISQKSKISKPRKQIESANDELSDEDISDLRKSGINVS